MSADGTRLAYETAGSGPRLVIVGGAFGTRSDARELAEAMSTRFTAVRYDRRGRGDSGDTQRRPEPRRTGRSARPTLESFFGN